MKIIKKIGLGAAALVCAFAFTTLSCRKTEIKGSADTVYAETYTPSKGTPAITIASSDLKMLEALQNSFRSISSGVLPSVCEIDVVEKTTVPANPFFDSDGFTSPFEFFFGRPDRGGDSKEKKGKTREYEKKGLGSGVIVRRTGNTVYVLTNNHVAGSATEISVKLNDGQEFTGKLVGSDERQDIALVSFECEKNSEIVVAKLGDSDEVRQGDICLAMGAPLGYAQSVTQGIVSATGRSGNQIGNVNDFIQTDAAINQGNSGGPLVNIYGEVIGINTWIASQSGGSQGLGFAMPINSVKKAIEDFISKGKVSYGWLGVSLLDLEAAGKVAKDYKAELGVKETNGAFVSQLILESPAAKCGFQAGDYIIELNGKTVKGVNELVRDVGMLPADKNASFKVIRGGKVVELNVKIEERSKDVASDNTKLWPGFSAAPLTDDVRKELKIEDKSVKGVAVDGIIEKTAAAALRLQNGDIITAVNGKKVTNLKEFYSSLDSQKGNEIWFDIYTEGHTITTSKYRF